MHLARYYGHRGEKGNLGKHRTAEHRANINMALSGKVSTGRLNKWIANLANCKTFTDTEGRMPRVRAGDADEKQHARWIGDNKRKEKGTNSEREKLMKRHIPLAFA